jgi:hypothetical protein
MALTAGFDTVMEVDFFETAGCVSDGDVSGPRSMGRALAGLDGTAVAVIFCVGVGEDGMVGA